MAIEGCGRSGRLLSETQAAERMKDTMYRVPGHQTRTVVVLSTEDEVRRALAHAKRFGLSVHPVSSGNNWGYGSALPADENVGVILDLGAMNRILEFDHTLGTIVLEPGVTQGQLQDYLESNGLDFMVPTTGAGPSCSLVGNALERGYGMTPVADHFQAVLGVRALFSDGSCYDSPLWRDGAGATTKAPVYRWGVGPYLDGLFAQNGGAIVTRLALQLMPRPERVEMFLFWIDQDEKLERIVEAIRSLLTGSGLVIGGINLMNADRVSAMAGASAVNGSAWIGTGVVYGQRRVVRAGRKVIRRTLAGLAKRVVFINERRLHLMDKLSFVPVLASLVSSVRSAYDMLSGRPKEFALSLAYQRNPEAMPPTGRNPARDGCGLLWYAPLVPMTGASAREYVEMVKRVCEKFGFSAPVTFSTLSVAGFDSTVPLIFPPDEKSSANATACLKALISEGRKLGFHPYRFHSSLMDEATNGAQLHWNLAGRIRAVIDPENLIAPRRYQRSRSSATPEFVS
ncbi:FAD-binding oxidoreductase [Brachymonas sp. M4Q-1]|uniref:FAD-binding oxidoreductase n=1 Tax=Brachymonas sp. M4Q-1 TaxID=3416906 RepID=UPI003CEDA09C